MPSNSAHTLYMGADTVSDRYFLIGEISYGLDILALEFTHTWQSGKKAAKMLKFIRLISENSKNICRPFYSSGMRCLCIKMINRPDIHVYVCGTKCICMYICSWVYTHTYVCVYISMYVCIGVCVCVDTLDAGVQISIMLSHSSLYSTILITY